MSPRASDLSRVERHLQLLLCLAEEPAPAGVTGMARRVGLGRTAVYRALEALIEQGLVTYDSKTRRYRLGKQALGLGLAVLETMPVRQLALPYLYDLREVTGETAILHTLVGHRFVAVDQIVTHLEPKRIGSVGLPRRLVDSVSTVTQVFAAFNPGAAQHVARAAAATPGDKATLASRFLAEAEEARELGYWITEALPRRANALALPVFNAEDHAEFAVTMTGPTDRWTRERMLQVLPDVRAIATHLGMELAGYEGSVF